METLWNNKHVKSYNLPLDLLGKELDRLKKEDVVSRIKEHDYTVWKDEPDEITNRLGWLTVHQDMKKYLGDINGFVEEVRGAGYNQALLLGMGGSSLAPEVYRRIFGVRKGYLDLTVLDSTNPAAIIEKEEQLNYDRTLFIVSTKSGGTIETISLLKYFYNKVQKKDGANDAGKHFVAITDPGSDLENLARKLKFRRIFFGDPDTGGRYSALSSFGLVPAALIGLDCEQLLAKANHISEQSTSVSFDPDNHQHPAWLGTALGVMGKRGRDKITLFFSPSLRPFGAWIEQLLAESTGKEGSGLLPVDGEEIKSPEFYTHDRLFIYSHLAGEPDENQRITALMESGYPLIILKLQNSYDLGREMFRWMMATSVAGWVLEINPFDQPDVEKAKVLAREMINSYLTKGSLPTLQPDLMTEDVALYAGSPASSLEQAWQNFFCSAESGDSENRSRSYIAIQAYLKSDPITNSALHALREKIETSLRMAVTVGYGPRFLHSTGQLHKGDAGKGLFIQLTADPTNDLPIPDKPGDNRSSVSFSVLLKAQALGDRKALINAGRKVISFNISGDISTVIKRLTASI